MPQLAPHIFEILHQATVYTEVDTERVVIGTITFP